MCQSISVIPTQVYMAGDRLAIYLAGYSLPMAGGWLVICNSAGSRLHHTAGWSHTFHALGRLVIYIAGDRLPIYMAVDNLILAWGWLVICNRVGSRLHHTAGGVHLMVGGLLFVSWGISCTATGAGDGITACIQVWHHRAGGWLFITAGARLNILILIVGHLILG